MASQITRAQSMATMTIGMAFSSKRDSRRAMNGVSFSDENAESHATVGQSGGTVAQHTSEVVPA